MHADCNPFSKKLGDQGAEPLVGIVVEVVEVDWQRKVYCLWPNFGLNKIPVLSTSKLRYRTSSIVYLGPHEEGHLRCLQAKFACRVL
jgi:hypothetical protein